MEEGNLVYGALVQLGVTLRETGNTYEPPTIMVLRKQKRATGLQQIGPPRNSRSFHTKKQTGTHSISWKQYDSDSSDEESYTLEYDNDPATDNFQFGRRNSNDFVIPQQFKFTSRFSFRIVCEREPPHRCYIFAAVSQI